MLARRVVQAASHKSKALRLVLGTSAAPYFLSDIRQSQKKLRNLESPRDSLI